MNLTEMVFKFFIDIIIIEASVYVAIYIFKVLLDIYKEIFPHKTLDEQYEDEIYKPFEEEEIFDEGYIEDLRNYDARINDIKAGLDNPVEIITDEYEKDIETK